MFSILVNMISCNSISIHLIILEVLILIWHHSRLLRWIALIWVTLWWHLSMRWIALIWVTLWWHLSLGWITLIWVTLRGIALIWISLWRITLIWGITMWWVALIGTHYNILNSVIESIKINNKLDFVVYIKFKKIYNYL